MTDPTDIIAHETTCRVGFVDDGEPYVVPLSFGWEAGGDDEPARFWFHSAVAGRKAGLIAARPRVCVQLDTDNALVTHPTAACAWTLAYRSVMAWGRIRIAADRDEMRRGLDAVMRQHAGRDGWSYPEQMLDKTLVWCVEVDRMTAKAHRIKDTGA